MNDDCGCSRATTRMTVFNCFQRGLKTRRLQPLPQQGPLMAGHDGLWVRFSLDLLLAEKRVCEIRFQCAACTSLIACCQALAETCRDLTCHQARFMCSNNKENLLPDLPAAKQDRARLAFQGLCAALPMNSLTIQGNPDHESRLHL